MYSKVLLNTVDGLALSSGTVRFLTDGDYIVEAPSGVYRLRRAAGCLLEPGPGDEVLFWEKSSDAGYILCVLEKKPGQGNVMSLMGNLSFQIREGDLSINADGVEIAGSRKISLDAPELGVNAGQARIAVSRLGYIGKIFEGACEKIHLTAHVLDSVVERLTQRAKSSFRWVTEMEQVQAGRIRTVVAETWSVISRKAEVKAKDRVKIKGEKIDLG
jgi:hypothetical protein